MACHRHLRRRPCSHSSRNIVPGNSRRHKLIAPGDTGVLTNEGPMRLPCSTRSRRTMTIPRQFVRALPSANLIGRRQLTTQSRRTVAQFLDWKPDTEVQNVVVNGYVRSVRNMKTEQFVNIGDGSTRTSLQAMVSRSQDERWANSAAPASYMSRNV